MRRRFGRRRWRGGAGAGTGGGDGRDRIDASWLARVADAGLGVDRLEPIAVEGVPDDVALLGSATREDGARIVVSLAPASGSDALLAGVVAAARLAASDTAPGEVVAISGAWEAADRRLLAALSGLSAPLRAVAASLGGALSGAPAQPAPVAPAKLAATLPSGEARRVFDAALAALAGLAAKHQGGLRGAGDGVELVIAARPLAVLRASEESLALEVLLPARSRVLLSEANLAETLDRLEGSVRKRLNEKKVRDGDEGSRAVLAPALARTGGGTWWRLWPLGESAASLDFVAASPGGIALGAARRELGLAELAALLRAAALAEPLLPALLADAPGPFRLGEPALLLAAERFDPAVDIVLSHLALDVRTYDVRRGGGATPVLTARTQRAPAAAAVASEPAPARREPEPRPAPEAERAAQGEDEEAERSGTRRRRRRGGRGRRPRTGAGADAEPAESEAGDSGEEDAAPPRFLEISAFDLDDESREGGDDGAGARRGRRRRRGRRSGPSAAAEEGDDEEPAEAAARPEAAPVDEDEGDEPELDDDELVRLAPDAPELDEGEAPTYEAEDLEESPLSEADQMRLERQRRRHAQIEATAAGTPTDEEDEEAPVRSEGAGQEEEARGLPRGRAAILAHADRGSIVAAALLAREVRQIEGIWIYPQEELMTFFRGVATDLRGNAPIYVVGFEARPAHDALQAASLYRDRLVWFDHHEWPPEDLHAMGETIGEGMLHVSPGCESPLAAVLTLCARRSRFSDKLVDLATGRFTQHDWDRWGRLWWQRLGDAAARPGEHRSDLEPLLVGRPSDLAKEAERVPVPAPPEEASFAASRDFPLVHFGGYSMVMVEVPEDRDLGLSARVLRERYGTPLSLARREGADVFVLGADEHVGRHAPDLGALVDHLAQKYQWVEPLSDTDHVARFRVRDLERHPDRADEVVSEIAMGRSLLDG